MEANSRYAEVSYWEERYATEDHYEWLGQGYQQALDLLASTLADRDARILILGCGNSHLSRDLRLLGGWNPGSDPELDKAVETVPVIYEAICQPPNAPLSENAFDDLIAFLKGQNQPEQSNEPAPAA